ncbi:glycosyltransferase [Devosia sp. MC532]|uniref:glycosyltransferase n=1 Tax=Devosia sp. MC532 TaxID=2799788 RepID=UPI0018F77D3E|nr:glycosyltransferase [Devosia sp. MC532]MBJ7579510.1 glycosyltransferase [Devosia sp. MC532]
MPEITLSKRTMKSTSVVTVTYKDYDGLCRTLRSISSLPSHPSEVVVVNGNPGDQSDDIARSFGNVLNLILISESDNGIYDAMNKGRSRASGDLVHYLNSGDTVHGNPYEEMVEPCLLPVRFVDEQHGATWMAAIGVYGYGYCHQGIIFPQSHQAYDTNYLISADFDLIIREFPRGLTELPSNLRGSVEFVMDGVSSNKRYLRDREIFISLLRNDCTQEAIKFAGSAFVKLFIPKVVRRAIRARHR